MKRSGLTIFMAMLVGVSVTLLDPAPSVAQTCATVCNQVRRACINSAKAAGELPGVACQARLEDCLEGCEGPLDRACVRGCKSTRQNCRRAVRSDAVACKKVCDTGIERQACFQACRTQLDGSIKGCEDTKGSCLGGCAGAAS